MEKILEIYVNPECGKYSYYTENLLSLKAWRIAAAAKHQLCDISSLLNFHFMYNMAKYAPVKRFYG